MMREDDAGLECSFGARPLRHASELITINGLTEWHLGLERSRNFNTVHYDDDESSCGEEPGRCVGEGSDEVGKHPRGLRNEGDDDSVVDDAKVPLRLVRSLVRGQYRLSDASRHCCDWARQMLEAGGGTDGEDEGARRLQPWADAFSATMQSSMKEEARRAWATYQQRLGELSATMNEALNDLKAASQADAHSFPLELRGLPPMARQMVELVHTDVMASNTMQDTTLEKAAGLKDEVTRRILSCSRQTTMRLQDMQDEFAAIASHAKDVLRHVLAEERQYVEKLGPMFKRALEITRQVARGFTRFVSDMLVSCDCGGEARRESTRALHSRLQDVWHTCEAATSDLCRAFETMDDVADMLSRNTKCLWACCEQVREAMDEVVRAASSSPQGGKVHAELTGVLKSAKRITIASVANSLRAVRQKEDALKQRLRDASEGADANAHEMDLQEVEAGGSTDEGFEDMLRGQERRAHREMRRTRLLRKLSRTRDIARVLCDLAHDLTIDAYKQRGPEWRKKLSLLKRGNDVIVVRDANVRARSYGAQDVIRQMALEKHEQFGAKLSAYVASQVQSLVSSVCNSVQAATREACVQMEQGEESATEIVQTLTSTVTSLEKFERLMDARAGSMAPEVSTHTLREAVSAYCSSRSRLADAMVACITSTWGYALYCVLLKLLEFCACTQTQRCAAAKALDGIKQVQRAPIAAGPDVDRVTSSGDSTRT